MRRKMQKKQSMPQPVTNRVFIWLALALGLSGIFSFQIWQNLTHTQQLTNKLEQVKARQQSVEQHKESLLRQIDLLQKDEYVLKLARTRAFFSLPDEVIFNILDENPLLSNEEKRNMLLQQNK